MITKMCSDHLNFTILSTGILVLGSGFCLFPNFIHPIGKLKNLKNYSKNCQLDLYKE